MTKQQNDVRTFMKTFGQGTPDSPTIPDEKTRILRVKLLLEEVLELAETSGVRVRTAFGEIVTNDCSFEAVGNTDLVGVADALADIDYVNQGAAVAYGLNLEPFQDEVHRSNMSKLWTLEELATLNGSPAYTTLLVKDKNEERCVLVKNSDGKVMKSPSYSKANLQKVLDTQLNLASSTV